MSKATDIIGGLGSVATSAINAWNGANPITGISETANNINMLGNTQYAPGDLTNLSNQFTAATNIQTNGLLNRQSETFGQLFASGLDGMQAGQQLGGAIDGAISQDVKKENLGNRITKLQNKLGEGNTNNRLTRMQAAYNQMAYGGHLHSLGGDIGALVGAVMNPTLMAISGAIQDNKMNKLQDQFNVLSNLALQKNAQNFSNAITDSTNMMFDNKALQMKAYGGPLGYFWDTFDNGVRIIKEGGTHEQNPHDGVQQGIAPDGLPNLVEEGEVIYNDFVYSDRLKLTKEQAQQFKLGGEMSYAQAALKLSKESEERPNDVISKNGLRDSMNKLKLMQEELKAKNDAKKAKRELNRLLKEFPVMQEQPVEPSMQEQMINPMSMIQQPQMMAKGGHLFADEGQMYPFIWDSENGIRLNEGWDFYNIYQGLNPGTKRFVDKQLKLINPYRNETNTNFQDRASAELDAILSPYIPAPKYEFSDEIRKFIDQVTPLVDQRRKDIQNDPMLFSTPALRHAMFETYGTYEIPEVKDWYSTKGYTNPKVTATPLEQDDQKVVNKDGTIQYLDEDGNIIATSSPTKPNKETPDGDGPQPLPQDPMADMMRMAPVWGSLAQSMKALSTKPNYQHQDAAIIAASQIPYVNYTPIGNYERFDRIDPNVQANALRAQYTQALNNMQNSGASRAAVNALQTNALQGLASALGEAAQTGRTYNNTLKEKEIATQLGIDQALLGASLDASKTNQGRASTYAQMVGAMVPAKQAIDDAIETNKYTTQTAVANNLGNVGVDKLNRLMQQWMVERGVYPGVAPTKATGGKLKYKTYRKKK